MIIFITTSCFRTQLAGLTAP